MNSHQKYLNVIDDGSGAINNNPENEKFIATEGGINYSALNGALALTFNSYITIWKDRAFTRIKRLMP